MTVDGDPLHSHCRTVIDEQQREIERLKYVNKKQADGWAKDHNELVWLRRRQPVNGLPQTREEAVSRLVDMFEGRTTDG